MLEALTELDSQIFLALHNMARCAFLDKAMTLFTGRFIWVPMYATLLLVFLRARRWQAALALALACSLAIALTDQTCATLIRPLAARLRPSNPGNPLSALVTVIDNYRGGAYGFPSCHAANSFALAVFASLAVRRGLFTAFIFAWATLNSYSRIYLGVHYPGDLLAGALIGAAIGCVCYLAAAAACRCLGSSPSGTALAESLNRPLAPSAKARWLTAPALAMLTGAATMAAIVIASAIVS